MGINGTDSSLDTLKCVGCQKFIDGEVIHDRFVVVHLVLRFLQACRGRKERWSSGMRGERKREGREEGREGRLKSTIEA